uniref:Protein kinase domain-containing protein n=1 Tax=Vitis vinifera TaxID=29760 RepID=F6HMA1_VITVI
MLNRTVNNVKSCLVVTIDPHRGLMCIYWMEMVHRDLKSVNCLVDKHLTIKICDFGLSWILTTTPMRDISSAGTPEWMAQELVIYAVANDGLRLEIPECPFGKLIADCWVEPDEGPNCDVIL